MSEIGPETLGRLYREHAPALALYAKQWTALGAEDLVQDAFIALARQRRVPEPVLPWLYTVVRHRAIALRRSWTRRRRRERHAAGREVWFTATEDHLDARAATEALQQLPLEQREVIVARLWGGLTLDAVSKLVGCSLATAQRRYQAGLATLKERLETAHAPLSPS